MELREVFEPLVNFLKGLQRKDKDPASKEKAKERLQLVLLQDRASVSPDFFEMMKKEIIEVIKKYIEIDEESLEVQLTRGFEDGDESGPALYANIPIKNIKPVAKKVEEKDDDELVTEVVNNENIIMEEIQNEVAQVIDEMVQNNVVNLASNDNSTEKVQTAQANVNNNSADNGVNSADVNKETEMNSEVAAEINVEVANTVDKEDDINKIAASAQIDLQEEQRIEKQVAERLEAIEKDANLEAMKDKINEVKDGVAETIQKVKKGAKDSIKKIKTKTQKKKIKE